MKKQTVIGLLFGGLLVMQGVTCSADVDTQQVPPPPPPPARHHVPPPPPPRKAPVVEKAKTALPPVAEEGKDEAKKEDAKTEAKPATVAEKKAVVLSFADKVKASIKAAWEKGDYEKSKDIIIGIPMPQKLVDFVEKLGPVKGLLEHLNGDAPINKLNIKFDFGYPGAGADQTGEYALSKGFAHIDASGIVDKLLGVIKKIPGLDAISNQIENLRGMRGSTVCMIKLVWLAKRKFPTPAERSAYISKELPLLLTRLASTKDFHGPADWIETFLRPFGLDSMVNAIKIDVEATTYYETKRAQEPSAFYKELSAAVAVDDLMTRQKNLSALLTKWKDTLKTIDFVDRGLLLQVIGAMVDDLKGGLKPEAVALYTLGLAQGQPVDGAVGMIDLLKQAIAATTVAGNFGPIKAGNGKEPVQADLVASLNQMLTTVTTISTGGKLPTDTPPSKLTEQLSVGLLVYLGIQWDSFMNNYWYHAFEGDGGYVKPLPLKGNLITARKNLGAILVRILQRYSDAIAAYKQTDDGKKAQAAIDAAASAAVALFKTDPKKAKPETKKAFAEYATAKKALVKAAFTTPVDFFYKWEKDPQGVMVRTIIKGNTDTARNFLGREVLRCFMTMPKWDVVEGTLNSILGALGVGDLKGLGITPEAMKSAAAKEEEKKTQALEKAGEAALADAPKAVEAAEETADAEATADEDAGDAAGGDADAAGADDQPGAAEVEGA